MRPPHQRSLTLRWGGAPPSFSQRPPFAEGSCPASAQVQTRCFPSALARLPPSRPRITQSPGRAPPLGCGTTRRPPRAPLPGALTEAPGPLLRGLLGEDPGGVRGVEGGGGRVGMFLAEEFAESARVLFHAAAGRAGAGGPSLPRLPCSGLDSTASPRGPLPGHAARRPPGPRTGRQVLGAPPLSEKCELPGQVRGCRCAPAPPRGRRRPAARLPRLHSCRLLPQPAIVGGSRWAGEPRPAHAQRADDPPPPRGRLPGLLLRPSPRGPGPRFQGGSRPGQSRTWETTRASSTGAAAGLSAQADGSQRPWKSGRESSMPVRKCP